ncbi:MAG: DMT family transporter [Pseudorhodoplanes sp.]
MAVLGRIGGWLYQQPYLLVCLTYLMWALNVVVGRTAAGHVPPVTLTMGRWVPAILILLPFAWPHLKRDWPTIRAHLPILFVLGFTGTTGYAVACYVGLQYTEALNGLLIQCTMPLMIGIMSFILVGDRLTMRQLIGIAVSLIGVFAILMRGDVDALRSIAFNPGDLWFVVAIVIFSFYAPLMRKSPKLHPLSFLTASAITGTLVIIPLYVWELATVPLPTLDLKTIMICLYLAVFPSVLAYICYNRGVQLIGPNRVAALYPMIVVFGSVLAFLFLGEQPQWYHLIGSLFIVGGVLLATRQSRAAAPSNA